MSRLIAELADATGISPREWVAVLEDDPRMFATVLDVRRARAERAKGP